ncbi:hypothetical protein Moror_6181 [Moniliophthora roreri MCA 2997]|uniref:Uncharacterized protein n=1 Tax=Moniliophthora roreri (strain MCA 2997) TaxID=1381753 RepID=V2WV91_MONRO|nr:hypothetical protein Moror_6181 [Moniliophthora roreri MCA 2997]
MFARFSALFLTLFGLLFASVLSVTTPADISAKPADLGGLSIGDIINALGVGLVKDINVTITLESLETNLVSIEFTAKNPLILELTLESVSSKAGLNGTTYSEFTHTFDPPLVVPILGEKGSGKIDNVLLTQGAIASLDIIPFGVLDLQNTDVVVRAGSIFGFGGIRIPINGLKQSNVPTVYNLELS